MASVLNVHLTLADIDRSHSVGWPRADRQRPIIVKFKTYRARQSLYIKRLNLRDKDCWGNVFINEDYMPGETNCFISLHSMLKQNC